MVGLGNRVLVVVAHYDDLEFNCGATVSRLSREGASVRSLCLSEPSYTRLDSSIRSAQSLRESAEASGELLGYEPGLLTAVMPVDNPDLSFPQEVMAADSGVHLIEREILDFLPDLVLTHFPGSTQPGHRNTAEMVLAAARRHRRMLSFEPFAPDRSLFPCRPTMYVAVSEQDVLRKQAALQFYAESGGVTPEQVQAAIERTRLRGYESGVEFAEAFEVVRWLFE